MSKKWIDTAISMFKDGNMMKDIAEVVGVSPQTVSMYLKRHGYSLNRKPTIRWNTDTVKEHCNKLNIEFLDEGYRRTDYNHTFKCKCGRVFKRQWNDITNKNKIYCSKCTIGVIRTKWDIGKVKEFCKNKDLEFLNDSYIDGKQIYNFKCKCGNEFKRQWQEMLNREDYTCSFCGGDIMWNTELVKKHCFKLGITFLSSEYITNNDVYTFECSCGNVFERRWFQIFNYNQTQCKSCSLSESEGEKRIREILTNKNIQFEQEKVFEDCRDKNPLLFDFYLPQKNTLIEFDGKQHFESIEYFGGEERLKEQQYRDGIKNNYAKDNQIKLLRIPYWEYKNIENIIENTFNTL